MTLGVYAAPLTPFTPSGGLALEAVPRYLGFLLDHGISGLLALGTNGEFASLTVGEREAVLQAFIDGSAGRVPVVANVGATAVPDVLALARHARRAGADAVALLPPYYYPLSDPGFEALVDTVADAFGAPVYLYNIPRYTGYAIPPTVVAAGVERGVVRGLKDSSQDTAYLATVRALAPSAELFVGSDTTLVEGLAAGADGVVSGMANTYPDLIVAVYRAFHRRSPDLPALRERLLKVRRLFARYPYLAATREALRLRGLDLGPPRAPLTPIAAGDRAGLAEALSDIHGRTEEVSG
ncbi:MAG TPA: dihydrodipicolinate synthase family protein [Trueperaceae bacterium]|nr:dihydrodipicolinate synthase family protein [Trueperaceae bacterium]